MEHFLKHLWEILLHTLPDTLRLVPFLFLTYLLMEYLEHKSGDASASWLRRSGKIGPLIGGAFGVVPQCGFSAAAAGLYSGRIITAGTLVAVCLSTSDEMLPLLISRGAPISFIFKILATKLVIGVAVGFLVDVIARLFYKRKHLPAQKPQIEEFCEREHCRCNDHFALSALKHTLNITLFVFIFTLLLNLIIHGLGEDKLASLILNRPMLGNLLAALVGIIPNCASSVVLTDLCLSGIIPVGAMLSGLLVNAGVALALLFRNNRPILDSFRILLILLVVGISVGILVDLTPLSEWLQISSL